MTTIDPKGTSTSPAPTTNSAVKNRIEQKKWGLGKQPEAASKPEILTVEDWHKAILESITTCVVAACDHQAELNARPLGPQDIRAVAANLKLNGSPLDQIIKEAVAGIDRIREQERWSSSRQSAFDRLLVNRFAHLLAESGEAPSLRTPLSRRMLPGFFAALTMMLGQDAVASYRDRCQTKVDEIRKVKGKTFRWTHFYVTDVAEKVSLDVSMRVLMSFTNFEKRINWLCEIINANLAPSQNADKDWQLDHDAARRFIDAFSHDLRIIIANPNNRIGLEGKLGKDMTEKLINVFEKFAPSPNK